MTLNVLPLGDNAQVPGVTAYSYNPDQLIAGAFPVVTHVITLAAGNLKRGAVLGQKDTFAYTVTPKAGGNTGTGSVGTVTPGAAVQVGAYVLTALTATTFSVTDTEGSVVGTATVGSAFVSSQVNFTITAGGTAFVAGDGFVLNATGGLGDFVLSVRTASDGTQVPSAILVDDTDATAGPVRAAIYASGGFNARAINYDPSWTPNLLVTALRPYGIHLKSSVSAADPT